MKQKKEKDVSDRTSLGYELIVRNNKASQEHGAPHLILRRQLKDEHQQDSLDAPIQVDSSDTGEVDDQDALEKQVLEIATSGNVAEYISSLHDHVPDEVIRVVDAIIEEEGNLPTNLPRLDDKLTMIYPGSDVKELPGDDLFFERKEENKEAAKVDIKATTYTNRVEYEDL